MVRKIIACILLISTISLSAQESTQESAPEPYEANEFHPALYDARRASIIFCGAFPLGFMYTSIVSDNMMGDTDFYKDKSEQERIEFKLLTSLVFAGIVMLIDFVIEKFFKG